MNILGGLLVFQILLVGYNVAFVSYPLNIMLIGINAVGIGYCIAGLRK